MEAIAAVDTITIAEAAHIIHKNPDYIRVGLQQGRFPWGSAVKTSEKQWSYNIIKKKFLEYAGLEVLDLEQNLGEVAKLKTSKYVAYRVPAKVLDKVLSWDCECSICEREFDKIWLVANNDSLYCEECLKKFDETLEGFTVDLSAIKYKVAKYDRVFRT